MNTIRARIKNRLDDKASVVETVLMFPIGIFLLFALINFSSYMQLRAEIQNVARDGARLVALYGGQGTDAIRNTSGKTVESQLMTELYRDGKCTYSYCSKPPTVDCTPDVARDAGEIVRCNIVYHYSPVAPVVAGLEALNGVFDQPISISSTYVSETGKKS
jgi:Flp pilus assembly protein TadG